MVTVTKLNNLVSGTKVSDSSAPTITIETCEDEVSKRLSAAIDEVLRRDKNAAIRSQYKTLTKTVIADYVKDANPRVEGFLDQAGNVEASKLTQTLINNFTKHGPVQQAMDSETITEIQINDYDSIYVEEKGVLRRYTEKKIENGKEVEVPVSFGDMRRYRNWVDRLLMEDNRKITEQNATIDAISASGIRINVVADTATVADREDPNGRNYSPINVTLRKQPKKKWSCKELVTNKTFSRGIARMLEIIPNSKLSTFVIGATGSGKTVLVNVLTDNIPDDTRVFAVGNPPELRLRRRDPRTGVLKNNIIHTKASPWPGDEKSMPTGFPATLNLIKSAMRVTPEIAIMEEMRVYSEFERFISLATSGHCVFSTFHSKDSVTAINRLIVELQSANPALTRDSILDIIASFLNIMVIQRKMTDGTRKVVELTEVCGTEYDAKGNKQIKLNYIYKFIREKEVIPPGTKKTKEFLKRPVKGAHYRVGVISKELQEHLIMQGFTEDDFSFISNPLEIDKNGEFIPEPDVYDYDPIFDFNAE